MKLPSHTLAQILLAVLLLAPVGSHSHEAGGEATYLGNEGVLVQAGASKVLFDPFFHNDYGTYQKVPDAIREQMFSGQPPFDDITAIVVSHAHGDHFDAGDLAQYLKRYPKVSLVAPIQAITRLRQDSPSAAMEAQLVAVALDFGSPPQVLEVGSLTIDVVRIPHAGWPQRRDVENLVFRVSFPEGTTVMHLGDADPNDAHFAPHGNHWQARKTHTAFPPYWFYLSAAGTAIVDRRINASSSVGVHVPTQVPRPLQQSGRDFFSKPGESRQIVTGEAPAREE